MDTKNTHDTKHAEKHTIAKKERKNARPTGGGVRVRLTRVDWRTDRDHSVVIARENPTARDCCRQQRHHFCRPQPFFFLYPLVFLYNNSATESIAFLERIIANFVSFLLYFRTFSFIIIQCCKVFDYISLL